MGGGWKTREPDLSVTTGRDGWIRGTADFFVESGCLDADIGFDDDCAGISYTFPARELRDLCDRAIALEEQAALDQETAETSKHLSGPAAEARRRIRERETGETIFGVTDG